MIIMSCIKQVYDLDLVLKNDWIVEEDEKTINIAYANTIMNPYDEASLELMLQLKEADDTICTKVVTIGGIKSETILRKALSVGVEKAMRVGSLVPLEYCPEKVAFLLSKVVKLESDVSLVLCGREADNGNHGQTGQMLAEMLGWPCITMVTDIKSCDKGYCVNRVVDKGIETFLVSTPTVITVTQSENKLLRMATLKAVLAAKKEIIEQINLDVYLTDYSKMQQGESGSYRLEKLSISHPVKKCLFIEDKEEASKTDQLIMLLKQQLENEVI